MCKELPVTPVNRVVDKKRIIGKKMESQGGGKAQTKSINIGQFYFRPERFSWSQRSEDPLFTAPFKG
jgi:hypothetical protein